MSAGSSPLARGLRGHLGGVGRRLGIIPARAGFTHHPSDSGHGHSGSSPLARGLRPARPALCGGRRIIPARAGFTRGRGGPSGRPGDHPRSRGVYVTPHGAGGVPLGSSPLARGLLAGGDGPLVGHRIIPARAGFTTRLRTAAVSYRDHPRSRGVYPSVSWPRSTLDGSSPLARGLHLSGQADPQGRRIIPARAGFTLADRWYPNEPVVYQTPAAFTADPGPAPPGRRSVAVVRGGASPLPDVLDATRPPRVFPAPVREPLRHAQTSGSVIRLEADRVDRADPHRHERGDDPRQGSDPGCRHQSDERGGHGEGRVVRHRDI